MKQNLARAFVLALLLRILVGVPALAEAQCSFPDLAFLLHTDCELLQAQYAFSDEFVCDAYVWEYPEGWKPEGDVMLAMFAQIYGGWIWEPSELEGHAAFSLANESGATAILVSNFEGRVLVLVPVGCDIADISGSSAILQSEPTVEPTIHNSSGGGHWQWQTREVDCPSCTGGWCPICNGTGSYRLYGEEVPCRISCSACDGLGYILQNEYIFVPEE